jgi:hypothetical protein
MAAFGPEYREGQTGQDRIAKYVVRSLPVSRHAVMPDFMEGGCWFTSAATLTCLPQPADPLGDFLARRPDDGIRLLLTAQPFFLGLAGPEMRHWNHALFWCPHAAWPAIRDHLASCIFRDGSTAYYTRWLDAEIPDTLALAHKVVVASLGLVPVSVLGLVGPHWRHTCLKPAAVWLPATFLQEPTGYADRIASPPQF